MRKVLKIAGVAAAGLWAGSAAAVNTPDYDIPYFAAQYAHEFSDYHRDADNGNGYQLTLGMPLRFDLLGGARTAVELSFYDVARNRHLDGNKDYQSVLMLDLVHDLGAFGWNMRYVPDFKPYGLLGVGVVQEDVLGERHQHLGGELGLGVLIPTPLYGLAVRLEGRAQAQDNDRSVAGENHLIDYRVTAGLQLPLSMFFDRHASVAPAKDCGVAVVDPSGQRPDCAADSDHDGVPDRLDQCPGTPSGTTVDDRGCPAGESGVLRSVEFDVGSANLTAKSKTILDGVAATLAAQDSSDVSVEVAGYTDANGSDPYNLMLSEQRAESVRQYLIGRGLPSSRLKAQGYGKDQPVASNDTAEGRRLNRRVEFRIIVQ